MLGRRINLHLAALARDGERHLSFEIEMLLSTAAQLAGEAQRAARRAALAAPDLERRQDELAFGERLLDRDHRLERPVIDTREARGAARELHARRCYGEQRLAAELDPVGREHRLVGDHRADVVPPRNVACGEHRDYARCAAYWVEVDGANFGAGLARHPERRVERAGRLRQVVDIARLTRDVQLGTIVRQRLVHAARVFPIWQTLGLHVSSSSNARGATRAWNLRSRFCAAVRRYHADAR